MDRIAEYKNLEIRQEEIRERRALIETQRAALQDRLQSSYRQRRIIYALCLAFGALILIGCVLTLLNSPFRLLTVFYIALPVYALVTLWAVMVSRARTQGIKEELQEIKFEEELLRSEATPEESRAEELLRTHQYQLRRYYDLNLSQNFWVFAVGIFCIFLGVVVVSFTIYLIQLSPNTDWREKLILGLVGAIGSLMTNYVAVIYLKMHSSITGSMTSFHSALASTYKLFLANLLVSRIDDSDERWKALAKLSLAVAEVDVSSPAGSSGDKPSAKKKAQKKKAKAEDETDGETEAETDEEAE